MSAPNGLAAAIVAKLDEANLIGDLLDSKRIVRATIAADPVLAQVRQALDSARFQAEPNTKLYREYRDSLAALDQLLK